MILTDIARAKVNLTLRVHGKLASGYHALESLVVFADFGDEIRLDPDLPFDVVMRGPFAAAVTGENLVSRAVSAALAVAPGLRAGRFEIDKQIPVAAGLGGGSADAAAALRLLRTLNREKADGIDWHRIAAVIGSDVRVCFDARSALMSGAGEQTVLVPAISGLWVVLANDCQAAPADKTRRVFAALGAAAIGHPPVPAPVDWPSGGHEAVVAWLLASGNDLEAAALSVLPDQADVAAALRRMTGNRIARMSGAGPTWFAVQDDEATARAAATTLASDHPNWWVRAARLG